MFGHQLYHPPPPPPPPQPMRREAGLPQRKRPPRPPPVMSHAEIARLEDNGRIQKLAPYKPLEKITAASVFRYKEITKQSRSAVVKNHPHLKPFLMPNKETDERKAKRSARKPKGGVPYQQINHAKRMVRQNREKEIRLLQQGVRHSAEMAHELGEIKHLRKPLMHIGTQSSQSPEPLG